LPCLTSKRAGESTTSRNGQMETRLNRGKR
jgi:hypothetical protein